MKHYVLTSLIAAPMLVAAMPASAVPQVPSSTNESIVEKARADCRWVDNKWTYRRGDKVIVCRPDRPAGRGWVWHREGSRFGWWNPGRKVWHFNAW